MERRSGREVGRRHVVGGVLSLHRHHVGELDTVLSAHGLLLRHGDGGHSRRRDRRRVTVRLELMVEVAAIRTVGAVTGRVMVMELAGGATRHPGSRAGADGSNEPATDVGVDRNARRILFPPTAAVLLVLALQVVVDATLADGEGVRG